MPLSHSSFSGGRGEEELVCSDLTAQERGETVSSVIRQRALPPTKESTYAYALSNE